MGAARRTFQHTDTHGLVSVVAKSRLPPDVPGTYVAGQADRQARRTDGETGFRSIIIGLTFNFSSILQASLK
jgi:hypothetical protein